MCGKPLKYNGMAVNGVSEVGSNNMISSYKTSSKFVTSYMFYELNI